MLKSDLVLGGLPPAVERR